MKLMELKEQLPCLSMSSTLFHDSMRYTLFAFSNRLSTNSTTASYTASRSLAVSPNKSKNTAPKTRR